MNSLIARLISGSVATAVIDWSRPFIKDELVANQEAFAALATQLTDPAYVNALLVKADAALPESVTIRAFRRHLVVPIKSVLTPERLTLLLAVAAGKEADALAKAHAALSAAYAAALAKA